jgi:hypothetical protein
VRSALILVVVVTAGCPPPTPPPVEDPLELSVSGPTPVSDDAPNVDGILSVDVPAHVKMFDLGALAVTNGATEEILVDVRSGLASLTFLVYGHEGGTVILQRALDPDGAAVINDVPPADLDDNHLRFARAFPAQVYSINRVFGSPLSGAFVVPNTPAIAAKNGTWRFVVGQHTVDLAANIPSRTALDRPVRVVVLASAKKSAGTIDLNVHRATAVDDAFLDDTLNVVRTTYAAASIEIGEVRVRDVSDEFSVIRLLDDQCIGGDLDRLLAESAGNAPGINLFVIERFSCLLNGQIEIGQSIGGSSAGLPGPPFVNGSTHAGVAIATAFANGDAQKLGVVTAHELGHFLGLYHTRESTFGNGDAIYDEIEDTPDDGNAQFNLMYFAADEDTTLTDDQSEVLRSSAWVTP